MKRKSAILAMAAVLLTVSLLGQSPVRAYEKWAEFTIVRITEPPTNSPVPQGKSITLKCVAALDIDVYSCTNLAQYNDTLTFTWTATAGTFTDNSGPEAAWTAPLANGNVTITVSASDDGAPVYADDTNRSHSITLTVVNPGIVYVNDNAGGSNDGTSWTNAYTDLNTAITNATAGSEIWVAAGTYKPADGSVFNSLSLNKDLKVYGGFAGTNQTALHQRDWVANVTTLSGDITGDNSWSVVRITNSSVVLDGFVITQGRGIQSDGSGVYIEGCSPTIRNCTFTDNFCDGQDADGGALDCWNASPTVVNCVFTNNTAGDDGGAVANKCNSNGKYINCAFYSNVAQGDDGKGDGGAVFNSASEANPVACNVAFVNCVFANNTTQRYGGAVALQEATTPSSSATYLNCTFFGNTSSTAGDVISSRNLGNVTTLKNCILWANNTDGGTNDIFNSSSTVNITSSDVQGGYGDNINTDPLFARSNDPDGADDRWLTYDDGLRIKLNSPCIDAADGDAKDAYTDAGANGSDAIGVKHVDIRTITDSGIGTPDYYDIGAYESSPGRTIFISVDGLASLYLNTANLMGAGSPAEKMNYFKRMRDEGAWTFNARSDPCYTETTPNHITMLTGRPVVQPRGWGNTTWHGWYWNGMPTDPTWTLHGYYGPGMGNPNDSYLSSVFDVVHDNGGTTAEYAGKDKFMMHEWSWDLDHGRADQFTPPNDGADKIDTFEWTGDSSDWNSASLISKFVSSNTPEYDFNFVFLHFKGPDKLGHQNGWGSTAWNNAVEDVNERVATVFAMVENPANKAWYGNTVIVLTADHGGHGTSGHGDELDQYNYTIPMGVWGHLVPQGDLYTLATNRTNPATGQKDYHEAGQPIRHADGVDLCLNLMGLPSIDGASIKDMKLGR